MRSYLVWFIMSWIFGLSLGVVAADWRVVLAILSLLVILAWRSEPSYIGITCGLLLLLGMLYGGLPQETLVEDCAKITTASGQIVAQPRLEAERIQYRVELENQCTVLVNAARFPVLGRGDQVNVTGGRLSSLAEFSGEFAGYGRYLRREGISAVWNYPRLTVRSRAAPSPWRALIEQHVWQLWPEPTASVIGEMVFAQRGSIPSVLAEQFRQTGTSHILSVSGLHVSLLAAMFLAILSRLPISGWVRAICLICLLWLYIAFIGQPISAVRAAAFWSLALVVFRLGLLVSLPNIILLTLVILLSFDPSLILDIGLQLSVLAVAGIWLVLFLTKPYRERLTFSGAGGQVVLSWLINSLLISLGATLATWPLVAFHFQMISFISVAANLLVVPPANIIIGLAIVTLLVSFIMPPAASLLAFVIHLLVIWLDFITKFFARLPGAFIAEISAPIWLIATYYLVVILVSIAMLRSQARTWREVWE